MEEYLVPTGYGEDEFTEKKSVFIGYARLNDGIDMFNHAQVAAKSQAYWTIQGSQNGIGLALHF